MTSTDNPKPQCAYCHHLVDEHYGLIRTVTPLSGLAVCMHVGCTCNVPWTADRGSSA